jgi:ribonucleotide reductase alpha subunit
MTSYILRVDEGVMPGKSLLGYLKCLSKTSDYVNVVSQKEYQMNGLDEAIEDIKMGRVTAYKNVEEYKKGMRKKFGYV